MRHKHKKLIYDLTSAIIERAVQAKGGYMLTLTQEEIDIARELLKQSIEVKND